MTRTINEVNGNPTIVETFPPADRLDRRQPHRIPISNYLELAIRSAPGRLREVPRGAIEEDGFDEEGAFALVNCPCGGHPIARYSIDKCNGCQRYYVCAGPKTFVIYGRMDPPEATVPPDASV